jgi:molybdate transport system ATP-binding protein
MNDAAALAPAITDVTARVGVLLYDTTTEVDAIMSAAVAHMQARGLRLAGLLQRFGERLHSGKRSMWLQDIESGVEIRLDIPRGPGATSCTLNPDALAQGAWMLHRAVSSGADLLIVNRFGPAEADGGGMRAEIAEAICSGAAVLIPAKFSLLDDLEGFLGERVNLLLPAPLAVADWAEQMAALDRSAM